MEVLMEVLEVELLGAEGRRGGGRGLAGRTRCTSGSRVRASSDREGRDPNESRRNIDRNGHPSACFTPLVPTRNPHFTCLQQFLLDTVAGSDPAEVEPMPAYQLPAYQLPMSAGADLSDKAVYLLARRTNHSRDRGGVKKNWLSE